MKSPALEHYNVMIETSNVQLYFGIKAVPISALVDKQGKIVMISHPGKRELDKDIGVLLRDQKLGGVGTSNTFETEELMWKKGLVPGNQVDANMEKFKQTIASILKSDTFRAEAKKMQACMI